ncbi:hypothetical protein ES332_A13G127900v1 [Gossypium tomentosum]|uniref:Protein kinase domain-containing protein n=1 Tax=Gossypium tomentosum TaxID=34277 RepID=A0A5D2MJL7_GOSTO|nr:hypothetical protein ES332_A13G127900v1 [Gossypium tomentosum]
MKICHRDLKMENTLLHGSTVPRLKICDFGYSKVRALCDKAKEILMEESNVQDWTGLNFQEVMDEAEKIRVTVHTLAFYSSILDSLAVELKASKDFSKLYAGIAILWLHLSLNQPSVVYCFFFFLIFFL